MNLLNKIKQNPIFAHAAIAMFFLWLLTELSGLHANNTAREAAFYEKLSEQCNSYCLVRENMGFIYWPQPETTPLDEWLDKIAAEEHPQKALSANSKRQNALTDRAAAAPIQYKQCLRACIQH